MLIKEFFENQEIFITGGSGFIGKALIEKLLRSCPNVGKIFVLIRGKKGKTPEERVQDLLTKPLFNRLREEQPQTLCKLHAIEGDCAELGLGINAEDLLKLQNVTTIYHTAASVRFDDALRDAIILNTRGTFEFIKIAETMKKLKVFVHVSTTYCYPDKEVLGEEVYPMNADWRTTIKLAETYNTETLNILNMKYAINQPNTYTFTKSLSEQIINEYKDKLPLIIFRPAIVISAVDEPVPGWVDNFNGPMGMLVACGLGILRSYHANPDNNIALVPIDVVVRAMLITAYKRALEGNQLEASIQENNQLEVINCSTANLNPISIGEMISIGRKYIMENPFEKTLWVPGGSVTRHRSLNFIKFILLHLILAVLVDVALRLAKEKAFLLKLQRRIYAALATLHFFLTTKWVFKNERFIALNSVVPKSEFDTFGFMQYTGLDYVKFFRCNIRGAKEFLLNESPDSSQRALLRLKMFQVADLLIKLLCTMLIVRFVVRYVSATYF